MSDGDRLKQAANSGKVSEISEMLKSGVDVNSVCSDGFTALQHACFSGQASVVQMLLDEGADPNMHKGDTYTCLILAAGKGNTAIVKTLLSAGADVLETNVDGSTAYLSAKDDGHNDTARIIGAAERKARLGWRREDGDSISFTEVKSGREITDLFNFLSRERTRFIRNISTDAEAAVLTAFDDAPERDIERAAEELVKQGGNNHTGIVLKSKKPLKLGK